MGVTILEIPDIFIPLDQQLFSSRYLLTDISLKDQYGMLLSVFLHGMALWHPETVLFQGEI